MYTSVHSSATPVSGTEFSLSQQCIKKEVTKNNKTLGWCKIFESTNRVVG